MNLPPEHKSCNNYFLFHMFSKSTGYCPECDLFLCSYCKDEHMSFFPNHNILLFYMNTMYVSNHDPTLSHKLKKCDYDCCLADTHLDFCKYCECIYNREIFNKNDFANVFSYNKVRTVYQYFQINIEHLLSQIEEEYKEELNSINVQISYSNLRIRIAQINSIMTILFDTYDVLNKKGINNIVSMINLTNNIDYLVDSNSIYKDQFKIRFKNDLCKWFDEFEFIKENKTFQSSFFQKIYYNVNKIKKITSICPLDENFILLGTSHGKIELKSLSLKLMNHSIFAIHSFLVNNICHISERTLISSDIDTRVLMRFKKQLILLQLVLVRH